MDNRRRRYVPLDVHLAFGGFGSALTDKWGMEGVGCWALFLAACKREPVEGTFVFGSLDEAHSKLGCRPSGFDLEAFFTFTGHHKKTRRRRHGRLQHITITSWETWNTPRPGSQKPSKSASNTSRMREDTQNYDTNATPEVEAEGYIEAEAEALEGLDALHSFGKLLMNMNGERASELDRLAAALAGGDDKSRDVLASMAVGVDFSKLADLRERAEHHRRTGKPKGFGWAIVALRGERRYLEVSA